MFAGPPEGSEVTWSNDRLPFRIVDDESGEISPVVGHIMIKYKKALIVWGGYYHSNENDIRYRSSSFLYILPAGVLACSKSLKWILYHVPHGDVPPSTSGSCAVLSDCNLFIFGGYVRQLTTNDVFEGHSSAIYVLDLIRERWSLIVTENGSLLPTPRDKMVGWSYRKKCYFFGGFGPHPFDMENPELYLRDVGDFVADETSPFHWNNQLLVFDPDTTRQLKWTLLKVGGTVPSARAASSCAYLEKFDSTILFGGRNRNHRLNDLYILDMSSLVWTQIETSGINEPVGRTWCSLSSLFPNQAILYGGYSNSARVLSDFWRLEVKKMDDQRYLGTWSAVNIECEQTSFRLWHTGAIVEGQLYVCGGTQSLLEDGYKIRGILKKCMEPASLLTLCLGAVSSHLKDVSVLPCALQFRCAWTRFIFSWGHQAFHLDAENFKKYRLFEILEMFP